MLELLGTIGGNILSLPGVLGLAFGMMTRKIWLAALVGGLVGVVETLIFAKMSFANVAGLELVVAVIVGILAGYLGCAIRRKGLPSESCVPRLRLTGDPLGWLRHGPFGNSG